MSDPVNLTFFTNLMFEKSGIAFSPDKQYSLIPKLENLITKYDLEDLASLEKAIKYDVKGDITTDFIDALTVNETYFFRDTYPFEVVDKYVIPKIKKSFPDKGEVRILCAACSTGQEPYSLAIHFLRHTEYKLIPKITAIDLSQTALNIAREGIYNQFEIQRGLSQYLLMKYFTQIKEGWRIDESVKNLVTFYQANLLSGLENLGKFDIIFCRNVLIYFDEERRSLVINNLLKLAEPHTTLIIGSSENIYDFEDRLEKITDYNGIYTVRL